MGGLKVVLFAIVVLVVANAQIYKRNHRSIFSAGLEEVSLDGPVEQWFVQKLDHFDAENNATWRQLYFVNDTYWDKEHGPVLFVLGGEGPLSPTTVTGHFVVNLYAEKLTALIVSLEHRFYGRSIPTKDSSTSNLRFLSSQQALADAAAFHSHIVQQYQLDPANNKWIVIGGSYSGSLSAWFRLKYPHLVVGSLATSAPVQAQLNFPEYLEVVAQSIGPACTDTLRKASQTIDVLLQQPSSRKKLEALFQTCTPINTDLDVIMFLSALVGDVSGIVQYNRDNNNYQPFDITKMCDILQNSSPDPVQALANFNAIMNNFTRTNCTEVDYAQYIQEMQLTNDGRSWTFQTCTEFGYFQTGDSDKQPFSKKISLEFYLQMCNDMFGTKLVPDIEWTNTYYGSKQLSASNVLLPNGSVDPWHILGILSSSGTQQAFFMNGTAHCADLYPPSVNDLPTLTETRQKEFELMQMFLHSSN